jgi:hypothetical protein
VDLLEEEMCRILQFLWWWSDWWKEQVGKQGTTEAAQLEGETAYASRQAAFLTGLATSFSTKWTGLAELLETARASAVAPMAIEAVVEETAVGALLRRRQLHGDEDEGATSDSEGVEEEGDEEGGSSGEEDEPIGVVPLRQVKSAYVDT